jgi:Fe-S cluster biogenesis protein NfuA
VRDLTETVQRCLNREVRPYLHIHGGEITLISVEDGVVTLRFEGACRGCPLRPVTLLWQIQRPLLKVPGIVNVQALGLKITESTLKAFDQIELQRSPRPG